MRSLSKFDLHPIIRCLQIYKDLKCVAGEWTNEWMVGRNNGQTHPYSLHNLAPTSKTLINSSNCLHSPKIICKFDIFTKLNLLWFPTDLVFSSYRGSAGLIWLINVCSCIMFYAAAESVNNILIGSFHLFQTNTCPHGMDVAVIYLVPFW